MMEYLNTSAQELEREYESLKQQYEDVKGKGLNLNMARGKPGKAQLDLSLEMLDVVKLKKDAPIGCRALTGLRRGARRLLPVHLRFVTGR